MPVLGDVKVLPEHLLETARRLRAAFAELDSPRHRWIDRGGQDGCCIHAGVRRVPATRRRRTTTRSRRRSSRGPWPEGCLIHTAGFAPDGTFRIFDVWDTKEHLDAFVSGTLMPLIEEMMSGRPDAPPPAKDETYELHDVAGTNA